MAYLADLANTNALVSTKIGGSSQEGRDIVQTIISSDLSANKPVLFFECNMHAREWITAATCIWIIDQVNHFPMILFINFNFLIINFLNSTNALELLKYFRATHNHIYQCIFFLDNIRIWFRFGDHCTR
jgi:hypothetical protein